MVGYLVAYLLSASVAATGAFYLWACNSSRRSHECRTIQPAAWAYTPTLMSPEKTSVRIVTLNVQGIPLQGDQSSRRALIESFLTAQGSRADVIVVQEAFMPLFRSCVYRAASDLGWGVASADAHTLPKLTGSGLMMMSRYALSRCEYRIFGGGVGSDALASKGWLSATVGSRLRVTTTHLQNGEQCLGRGVHTSQMHRICGDHLEHTDIVLGDFNVPPEQMLGTGAFHILAPTNMPTFDNRIVLDYALSRFEGEARTLEDVVSDHQPVEVLVKFS